MAQTDMVFLGSKKLQIGNIIIAWVFIFVMNNFGWQQITANMGFHDQTVFKDIFLACSVFALIQTIRVSNRGSNQDITVLPNLLPAFPSWAEGSGKTEHRVIRATHALTEHGVFIPTNISMKRGVAVRKIVSFHAATFRAMDVGATGEFPKIFTAKSAWYELALPFSEARANRGTISFFLVSFSWFKWCFALFTKLNQVQFLLKHYSIRTVICLVH